MEKSASFHDYGLCRNASVYLGIEPLLQRAASTGDAQLLLTLLQNGVNPNFQLDERMAPLHLASKNGHVQCTFYLLQFSANVNMVSKRGVAPLHLAARHGHVQVVRLLLDHGADPDLMSKGGLTPFHLAARHGHEAVIEVLIDKGATVDSKTCTGLTSLHLACESGHVGVVTKLLDHGRRNGFYGSFTDSRSLYNSKGSIYGSYMVTSDVNAWTTVENFAALHVASHAGHADLVELLLSKYQADVDQRSKHDCTPLHLAALKGNKSCVESLIKYGANIEAITTSGFTALHLAALQQSSAIVSYLLPLDADPNIKDGQGRSPLHLAIMGSTQECQSLNSSSPSRVSNSSLLSQEKNFSDSDKVLIVESLLKFGADPDAFNAEGQTALHLAIRGGHNAAAKKLLEGGANPNICDKKTQRTPLHLACQEIDLDNFCEEILAFGGDLKGVDGDGNTALHFCSLYGRSQTAKILISHGADMECRSSLGYTPLHVAAHYGQVEVARVLLEAGAQPDNEDHQGFTALHHAAQLPTKAMVNLLLLFGTDRNRAAKNGHTAQSIAKQLGRPAVLGALKRTNQIESQQPLAE